MTRDDAGHRNESASSAEIEARLRAHYRAQRTSCGVSGEQREAVAHRALVEAARIASAAPDANVGAAGSLRAFVRFVLGQARFIRKRVWAAQAALVIVMVALCGAAEWMFPDAAAGQTALLASLLGAAAVAVGLPDLMASRVNGTEELEYACRFDCRSVMLARMILLGGSEVLAVTVAAIVAPAVVGTSTFSLLLHACAPYFLACLGCLALARRLDAQAALPAMVAWTALVMMASIALYKLVRMAYETASVGAWALVAAAAAILALREARRWLDQVSAGLDCLGTTRMCA